MMLKSEIDGLLMKYLNATVSRRRRYNQQDYWITDARCGWEFQYELRGVDDDDDRTIHYLHASKSSVRAASPDHVGIGSAEELEGFLKALPKFVVTLKSRSVGHIIVQIGTPERNVWIELMGRKLEEIYASVRELPFDIEDPNKGYFGGKTTHDDAMGCIRFLSGSASMYWDTAVDKTAIFPLIDAILESDMSPEVKAGIERLLQSQYETV